MNYSRLMLTCAAMVALTIVVCGVLYPLAVTLIAAVAFPQGAAGSPVHYNGTIVGSKLIGQDFSGPEYFHPRPSAVGYNASTSGASNLGPHNPLLAETVKGRLAGGATTVDAVLGSGSGLDPDISLDNALAQAPRVADANGLSEDEVRELIASHAQGRFLVWGEPRVNVLELNLAVQEMREQAGRSEHV